MTDWVQAGRYAAALDPLTRAGGPTAPASPGGGARPTTMAGNPPRGGGATTISIPTMTTGWNRTAVVPVTLQAQGVENGVGFSVTFDPTRLTFVSAALGPSVASAVLNVNALAAAGGRVGLALALASGQTMPTGTYPILLLTFQSAAGAGTATTPIGFGDDPVIREVSDAQANVVPASYQGATITLGALPTFTDDPLQAGVSPVKLIHVTELRQRIDDLRARFALGAFAWTDAALVAGVTPVRAAHLVELRLALAEAYAAANRAAPAWSPTTVSAGTTVISAASFSELRAAVLAMW